jgi:hypothetical protein
MATYLITMTQHTTWEFEVEAESEDDAFEITAEWGRDEMVEEEITSQAWETEFCEV